MPKRDEYHHNYLQKYPELIERLDVLELLKRSERKIEYLEVDLINMQPVVLIHFAKALIMLWCGT